MMHLIVSGLMYHFDDKFSIYPLNIIILPNSTIEDAYHPVRRIVCWNLGWAVKGHSLAVRKGQ